MAGPTTKDYLEFMANALSDDPMMRAKTKPKGRLTPDPEPADMRNFHTVAQLLAMPNDEADLVMVTVNILRKAD